MSKWQDYRKIRQNRRKGNKVSKVPPTGPKDYLPMPFSSKRWRVVHRWIFICEKKQMKFLMSKTLYHKSGGSNDASRVEDIFHPKLIMGNIRALSKVRLIILFPTLIVLALIACGALGPAT
jgi:hypothetical protein